MKKLLFAFMLIFSALQAQAQTPTIVKDTTYQVVSGSIGYTVSRIDYSDGTYSESRALLGDTTATFNSVVSAIEKRANEISAAAIIAMNARQFTNESVKKDTLITALLGRSPITFLMDTYTQEFTSGSWALTYNGATTAVTFPVLSTNKRRRLLPQGGTARTMIVFGNMMRLVNYPVTGNNILYRVKEGYWASIDKSIILQR